MPEITGLLLAAGSSRRFGGHKLLTEIDGRPLVLHAAECLQDCDRLLAIVRSDDVPLQQCLHSAGIDTVFNPHADRGMGGSLVCGVAASASSDGWCILPADMPYIANTIGLRIVLALHQGASIAAPYYRGRRGHPVGFSQVYREQLLALDGDTGARKILARESQAVVRLEIDDAGILRDIDTPQDFNPMRIFCPEQASKLPEST
jgi:molybdenum cofactor cytidylyltransferase